MNVAVSKSSVYPDGVANYHPGNGSVSSLPFPANRVRVQAPNSLWGRELEGRFNELTSLPRGWDGYNGRPVSFICAHFAANLIERLCVANVSTPQMVPGADGTLQLEWHFNGFDIEVDVLGPYSVIATRFDHVADLEEEIIIQTDFSELAKWIEALGEARADLQQVGN